MGLEHVDKFTANEASDFLSVILIELVDADDSVHGLSSGIGRYSIRTEPYRSPTPHSVGWPATRHPMVTNYLGGS